MSFIEFIKDASLIVASWTAIYGIDSWRREYRGKKQAELAEEALCLFYEGRDAIRHIRSPFAHGEEGKTRKARDDETPEQKGAYDKAYVLIERYNTHLELFNKLHSMRYRFMAQFGVESGNPFEDFRKLLNRILVSAQSLARSNGINGVNSSLLTERIGKCYKAWYGETASGAISRCCIPRDLPGQ